jgi:hypothetical protein
MRWLDSVESVLKKMKVKRWKFDERERKQWRLVAGQGSPRAVEPTRRKEGRKEGKKEQLSTEKKRWIYKI